MSKKVTAKTTTKQRMNRVKVHREQGIQKSLTMHRVRKYRETHEVPLWRRNIPPVLCITAQQMVEDMGHMEAKRVILRMIQNTASLGDVFTPEMRDELHRLSALRYSINEHLVSYSERIETLHLKKHNIPGFGFHRRLGFSHLRRSQDMFPDVPVYLDVMRRIAVGKGYDDFARYKRKQDMLKRGKRMVL